MKIAIDLSTVTENKAGIGYYASELTKALLKLDKENQYLLYTFNAENLKEFTTPESTELNDNNINSGNNYEIVEIKANRANFRWIFRVLSNMKKKEVDLLISPSLFTFGILFPNTIQIVHDLIPIEFPQFWPKKASLFFKYQLKLEAGNAKAFVTNSNTTTRDLNEAFPVTKDKTYYIGGGLHSWALKEPKSEELARVKAKYNLGDKYFLSVGTLQPRKNYIRQLEAFAKFVSQKRETEVGEDREIKDYQEYQYVIAGGKGWYYDEIFKKIKELGIEDKVKILGYVDEEDLAALYKLSSGLMYASLYEGFVLPCLEAYAMGVPILTADITLMNEELAEKAVYVDPENSEDIFNGLLILKELKHYSPEKEFLKKYSWEEVAKRLITVYEKI